jgi:DNA (cytosine-5)-methyltransferase 1
VENVQAFLMRKVRHPKTGAPVSAANYLIDELSDRYAVFPLSADLADFGVPQSRKRSFLTFILWTEPAIEILSQRHKAPYPWLSHANAQTGQVCLEDALASFCLPPLDARKGATACSDDQMHSVPVWPDKYYRMVHAIPAYSGQSAWDNDECVRCGTRTRDVQRVRCSRCRSLLPRPITEGKNGELRLVTGFHSSYRRMNPDEPAATITTASGHVGSDRTIHPWENRVLSPLECALLQTFPRNFEWGDALQQWGHTNVRSMIGEAVPPLFTKKHGRTLSQLLRGIPPRLSLAADDRRVQTANRSLKHSGGQVPPTTPALSAGRTR